MMECWRNLSIFVVLILVGGIQLAPVEENKRIYDLIKGDKRFEKLPFIKECEAENKPICSALLDIALRFNETRLEFAKTETKHDDDFCQRLLLKVLPDTPASPSTVALLESYNVAWFKDTLKESEDTCRTECMLLDESDYSQRVKRVCFFVYDQYKLLVERDSTKPSVSNTSSEGQTQLQQQKTLAAVSEAKVTSPQVTEQKTNVIVVSQAGGGLVDVVPAQVEIKNIAPTASINKSVPEQQKPEQKPQESKPVVTNVKELSLSSEKVEPSSVPAASSSTTNKSETAPNKEETKTSVDLENNLDDHGVFDENVETQVPDKDQDLEMGDLGDDDEDENYREDNFARDNNRETSQKFPPEQTNEIDGPDSDSAPHVQSVQFQEDPDSNFFTYLCITMFLSILLYILYHNRQKLLALVLEGRRGSRRSRERSRGGSKAAYSKLDCNLEEAITSKKSLSGKSMDIIY